MAFSFDPALGDDVSKVRQLVNDTVSLGAKFSDEAITFYLTEGGTIYEASGLMLDQLANRYALLPDVQIGTKRMSGSQISDMLTKRADVIRALAGGTPGVALPYVAGLSRDEIHEAWNDWDIPKPPRELALTDAERWHGFG